MYAPSFSPIRRMRRQSKPQQSPEILPTHQIKSGLSYRMHDSLSSPQMTGDYRYLKNQVDSNRISLRDCRAALANALDRLGEHHVRNKEYDDAMDAFTEALHEKRSVYSQLIASHQNEDGNRSRANTDDSQVGFEDDSDDQLRDETLDEIVQTLRNMGNVHSLRGEQDEAMRYYAEVTNLRANRSMVRDARSVGSFSKSSVFGTDEETSTLMSEINEDVRALDDLFRSISFRNAENAISGNPDSGNVLEATTKTSDSPRKRRRGDGLLTNGSCENEPFKRSSSIGVRSNNELADALESYKNFIDTYAMDKSFHEEQLNSFKLRAALLQDNDPKIESSESASYSLYENHPSILAELQLALELYRLVMSHYRDFETCNQGDVMKKSQVSAIIASILIRMGSLCYKLNNVDEELELYREAEVVYTNSFGADHAYVAGTRKNIGMVLAERGQYEEAIEQFEKARLIYLKVNKGEETNRDVASSISCMGNVMNRMGELDEALDHYLRALKIYQLVLQRDNADDAMRDVIATLKIIGMVYGKKGELDTAMDYFLQALNVIKSLGLVSTAVGKDNIASISSRIAGIHFKKGEYDKAMEHYKAAHDLTVELKGFNHPDVAGIKHYIGGIHHKNQEYEEAMQCYQEAVRVYHATLGPGHPAVAATLVCIGSLHYKKRNLDSAMMFYREALRLNRDAYGLHHPDVAPTLKSIGTILTKKGDYDEAYQVFRDVLSIKCTVHGTGHPEVANAYKSLGNIHYKRGELADAERQYRHALNIYRQTKGEDHPETISARTSIDHIKYWMKERGQRQVDGRDTKNSTTRRSHNERC